MKKRKSFPRQYVTKGTKKLIHGACASQDLGAQTPWSLSDPKAKQQKTSVRNVGEEQECLNGYLSGSWKQWTLSTSYPFLPFPSGWNLVGKVSGATTSIKRGKGESLKQDRGGMPRIDRRGHSVACLGRSLGRREDAWLSYDCTQRCRGAFYQKKGQTQVVGKLEKNIQPMRPAGESRQLRLKTLSKSSAALRFATHGIWCFWAPLPTATISLNKQDLLKPSVGMIFHPSCERVHILYDSKHTARVALGAAHPRRNIYLASKCYDFVLRTKE